VGCGTGLCFGPLRDKVTALGGVVGIEESPEMAAVAREHIAAEGWLNVTVVESPAEDARMAFTADAALFCAVHDILQSPDALRNVLGRLRPGAWVAAGGGKWAAPLMVAVNMQVRMLHAPYVRSFDGFDRPWDHLEQLIEGVHVEEVAFGGGYIATGRVPPRAPA
jgi:SAM-dependent methyltransferase